jgi:hypothetical protein
MLVYVLKPILFNGVNVSSIYLNGRSYRICTHEEFEENIYLPRISEFKPKILVFTRVFVGFNLHEGA